MDGMKAENVRGNEIFENSISDRELIFQWIAREEFALYLVR
jgi:hypothetical protein